MPTNSEKKRGKKIAETSRIRERKKGGYAVPSQSGHGFYLVDPTQEKCECPDYEHRHELGVKCKHIYAVEIKIKKTVHQDGSVQIEQTVKKTYSQNWTAYNEAQTNEKTRFMELLADLCGTIPNPEHKKGRPSLPLSDMIYASALKVYTGFSLRRFVSDMEEAVDKKHIEKACSYSTVSNYMRKEDLTPVLCELIKRTAKPLASVEQDFAVDSSGFSTSRFERWHSFKHGRDISKRVWVKAHIMCGVNTNTVTAVKLTEQTGADSPQFEELVDMTAENFEIEEVSADKAYISKDNLRAVMRHGGTPYIPFKRNAVARARSPRVWKKAYHYFQYNREEFLQHYHKRSNVETAFHMIKTKFGDSVRSKDVTAQQNEVLLKVLCHNIVVLIHEACELGAEFCLKTEECV